jgi:hypothetical protein
MKNTKIKEKILNNGKNFINPLNNLKNYFRKAEILYKKEQKFKKKNSCLNLLKNETKNSFNNNKSFLFKNSLNKSDFLIKNFSDFDSEKINIFKKIQEIRKNVKNLNSIDFYNKINHINYDKKHIKLILHSNNLLNKIKQRNANKLNEERISISQFLNENKEISLKNVLIKLLHEESNKLNFLNQSTNHNLEKIKINFLIEKKIFFDYKQKQKDSCKEIESILLKIQQKNKELLLEINDEIQKKKELEDNIEKILFNIENKRFYGIFIEKLLNEKNTKFNCEIFPKFMQIIKYNNIKNNEKDKKITIENLSENIIKNYSFFLEENNIELKKEKNLLKEENLYDIKYKEIENNIINNLIKSDFNKNFSIEKNENLKEIEELNKRLKIFENEYKNIKYEFNNEKIHYENLCSIKIDNDFFNKFINYLIELGIELDKNNFYKTMSLNEILKNINFSLAKKEILLNKLIFEIKNYQKIDKNLILEISNKVKIENKNTKQIESKKLLESLNKIKKIKTNERHEKIVIKSRKTEAPFQKQKKIKNILKKESNKQIENEALLSY